jgi:hypothetical protein
MEKLKDDLIKPKDHRQHIQHSSVQSTSGQNGETASRIVKIAANNSKKWISRLLAMCMVLGCFPGLGAAGQAA